MSGLTISKIASGDYHTCVIASDSQAYCWGVGNYGQIGNGSNTPDNYLPQAVDRSGALKDKTLIGIDLANNYSCVTASDGHLYCWGLGIFGKDENQTLKSNNVPVSVR